MNAVTFANEILAMSRELDSLRNEVARLKHYEAEYNTLVRDSIRHSHKMMANTMDLIMRPGVSEALRASVGVPEGFTPWTGGERPVDKYVRVQLLLRNGDMPSGAAWDCRWLHCGNGEDVVGYRVVEDVNPETPEGFTSSTGGERPVAGDVLMEVIFNDGNKGFCSAAYLQWASTNPPTYGNIAWCWVVK